MSLKKDAPNGTPIGVPPSGTPSGTQNGGVPKGKYIFGTVKVGEKGQIVIPKEARDVFNIKPGDMLLLLGDENQGIAIVKSDFLHDALHEFSKQIMNAREIKEE